MGGLFNEFFRWNFVDFLKSVSSSGSGKTAAFVIPMIQQLLETGGGARKIPNGRNGQARFAPVGLVLSPTRELAIQIHDEVVAQMDIYKYF